jgi:hypothetical protein
MSSILISSKPSVIAGSKFGPKEVIVYCVPSIDDCLALLPRHLGNYILSFTYAWLEFYLDNLVEKYGVAFVNLTLAPLCIVRGRTTQNRLVLYKNNIAYIKKHNIDRGIIHHRFERALVTRKKEIEQAKQRKEIENLKKKMDMERLSVGSIFVGGQSYHQKLYLVIQKTEKTYYCVSVTIESETETHYTLKFNRMYHSSTPLKYSIRKNEPILEVGEPIKPPKLLMLKDSQVFSGYAEAEFTQKTKRHYFMRLFGYNV